MQKVLLILGAAILFSIAAKAQKANMIFFSPNEEKFYLVVNGVQQNSQPMANVKITDMAAPMQYIVKIKFENTKLGVINDKVSLLPDTEKSWSISARKKKGTDETEYVIRTAGQTDRDDMPPADMPPAQIIVYHTETIPGNSMAGDGVSMSMNVNEQGGNINFNMNGGSNTTTSSTMTTTTTSSMPAGGEYNNNGNSGCGYAMSSTNFYEAKKAIKDADFEDTKLSTAKTIVSNNCVTADQVAEICRLFDFEATKLAFAKFAYSKTYDKNNYFKVNNVFDFDASKDELNRYIQGR